MAEVLLRLKDYLELDAWGDSHSADAATVRQLLDAELRDGRRLVRSRSGGALARLSSAVKLKLALPFSSPSVESCRGVSLSRSFSKRLRAAGFWRKRTRADACQGKAMKHDACDVDGLGDRGSFDFPSPVVSSCSSWSETGSISGSDFLRSSRGGSSECTGEIAEAAAASVGGGGCSLPSNRENGRTEPKVVDRESMECQLEEGEHLSPVSVMDFASEDDEEDAEATTTSSTSPTFRQRLPTEVERAHSQLAKKLRRFDGLAELEPVALEGRFATFDGACQHSTDHVLPSDGEEDLEKLLLDFFVEGISSCCGATGLSREREEARLLEAARGWVDGDGWCWERWESRAEMEVAEMERNGRWRCFDEEVGEVGEDLEGSVADLLLAELLGNIVDLY